MSKALLLAALSVPKATLTPLANNFLISAIPLASFILLLGLETTVTSYFLINLISLSLR